MKHFIKHFECFSRKTLLYIRTSLFTIFPLKTDSSCLNQCYASSAWDTIIFQAHQHIYKSLSVCGWLRVWGFHTIKIHDYSAGTEGSLKACSDSRSLWSTAGCFLQLFFSSSSFEVIKKMIKSSYYYFQPVPLGIATADHLPPSYPTPTEMSSFDIHASTSMRLLCGLPLPW